jgi:hypothetical protein
MGNISTAPAVPIPHVNFTALLSDQAHTIDRREPVGGFPAAIFDCRRSRIEAAIEALIALLDTIDGDADAEPNGDEDDFTEAVEEDWQGLVADCGPGTVEDAEDDNEDCSELEHAAAWGRVARADEDTRSTPGVSVSPLKDATSQSLVEITMEHLTRTALARELNIGRSTLHRMEQAGLVPPAVRVSGNRSLFSPDAQAVARNLVEAMR